MAPLPYSSLYSFILHVLHLLYQYHSPRQLAALGAAPGPYLGMKAIAPAFMQ